MIEQLVIAVLASAAYTAELKEPRMMTLRCGFAVATAFDESEWARLDHGGDFQRTVRRFNTLMCIERDKTVEIVFLQANSYSRGVPWY